MAFLAKYFKQEVLGNVRADVDIVIRCLEGPEDAAADALLDSSSEAAAASEGDALSDSTSEAAAASEDDATHTLELARFPAHSIILDNSEYFKVQQAPCWRNSSQSSSTTIATLNMPVTCTACNSSAAAQRPTVKLVIDSAEQLPAAEAVIAAMYGVPDAISSLEQHQVVYVAAIADMVHAEAAGEQTLQVLQAAAKSKEGLTQATLQALAALPAWPSCLLQMVPAVFDDLQAVWSDAQLQQLLLGLPLPAMQLLLSSDQLRVPSEDTVLYTAKQYVKAQTDNDSKAAARAALAPLVRAPQLSMFALSCAALPADSGKGLLGAYVQQLRDLLSLKRIASAQELATELKGEINKAPDSWQLGPRQIKPLVDGVRLEWRLPVEQLKQACRDSLAQQQKVRILSTGSAPLGGVAWNLILNCVQVAGGTEIRLYAGPVPADTPAGIFGRFKYTSSWQGKERTFASPCMKIRQSWGSSDFFYLQPMAGDGWDESVLAAAGLLASGDMLLELCVHSVE